MSQWFDDNQCVCAVFLRPPCLFFLIWEWWGQRADGVSSLLYLIRGTHPRAKSPIKMLPKFAIWLTQHYKAAWSFLSLTDPSILTQMDIEMRHPGKRGKRHHVPVITVVSTQALRKPRVRGYPLPSPLPTPHPSTRPVHQGLTKPQRCCLESTWSGNVWFLVRWFAFLF